MSRILNQIGLFIKEGRPVYVHCLGGVGRTGTVVGCYLMRHGLATPENVLEMIRKLREDCEDSCRQSPETIEQWEMRYSLSKDILNEALPKESEDFLSTTVSLKLHLMDIRDLRKYNLKFTKIEYQYYTLKERVKEEQKALREQMRQEAAERKELEEEQKKVDQEEEKYRNEMLNIQEQVQATDDALKIAQLEERLEKIQAQLGEVEQKKEEIAKLQHGQAGYIYILSNLSSYGENIFKIGMTRRINPQDRCPSINRHFGVGRFDKKRMVLTRTQPVRFPRGGQIKIFSISAMSG